MALKRTAEGWFDALWTICLRQQTAFPHNQQAAEWSKTSKECCTPKSNMGAFFQNVLQHVLRWSSIGFTCKQLGFSFLAVLSVRCWSLQLGLNEGNTLEFRRPSVSECNATAVSRDREGAAARAAYLGDVALKVRQGHTKQLLLVVRAGAQKQDFVSLRRISCEEESGRSNAHGAHRLDGLGAVGVQLDRQAEVL